MRNAEPAKYFISFVFVFGFAYLRGRGHRECRYRYGTLKMSSRREKGKRRAVSIPISNQSIIEKKQFDRTPYSQAFEMTFTRTSPALGGSTVISSSTKGCLGARATMALHLIGNPSVDMFVICFCNIFCSFCVAIEKQQRCEFVSKGSVQLIV